MSFEYIKCKLIKLFLAILYIILYNILKWKLFVFKCQETNYYRDDWFENAQISDY